MNDSTWPEQGAIDRWFEKYSHELKTEVSRFRIDLQKENESLKRKLKKMEILEESLIDLFGHPATNIGTLSYENLPRGLAPRLEDLKKKYTQWEEEK